MADIIIFTGSIQSGKTTRLVAFCANHHCGGFLTPDIDGIRHFLNLATGKIEPFQMKKAREFDAIEIGKFIFRKEVFLAAQEILNHCDFNSFDYFVIDEVGKLELKNEGLEPALGKFIENWKDSETSSTLILVVRDYLLEEVISKYDLKDVSQYLDLENLI